MITKLIGVATLFAAGSSLVANPALGAIPVSTSVSAEESLSGGCGSGSCGSKETKKEDGKKEGAKGKKEGSCGKHKKEASCGKDKKEASCGKDKKG